MTQPAENHPKNDAKPSFFPLILAALVGGSAAFILSQLQFGTQPETPDRQSAPPVISTNPTGKTLSGKNQTAIVPKANPNAKSSPAAPKALASSVAKPSAVARAAKNGLRVSNQSPNALRVVLLSHQSSKSSKSAKRGSPAHWDFAPSEGSRNGLLLSLPSEKLTLKPGDVLVAFALDGSRRYWGPYVVGETAAPTQSRSTLEWQLVLRP
jgi:hypothetical protein